MQSVHAQTLYTGHSVLIGMHVAFVCWNGDPFDLGSRPVAVYGEGALIFSD
jgi:hypothetical protein